MLILRRLSRTGAIRHFRSRPVHGTDAQPGDRNPIGRGWYVFNWETGRTRASVVGGRSAQPAPPAVGATVTSRRSTCSRSGASPAVSLADDLQNISLACKQQLWVRPAGRRGSAPELSQPPPHSPPRRAQQLQSQPVFRTHTLWDRGFFHCEEEPLALGGFSPAAVRTAERHSHAQQRSDEIEDWTHRGRL